jgi:glyoxylate reductase
LEALDSGSVSAVALDVTDPEPLPPNHPLFSDEKYRGRVLIVPHIGSATVDARTAMARLSIEHVDQGLQGQALSYAAQ